MKSVIDILIGVTEKFKFLFFDHSGVSRDVAGGILIIIAIGLFIVIAGKWMVVYCRQLIKKLYIIIDIIKSTVSKYRNNQNKKSLIKKFLDLMNISNEIIRAACCTNEWRYSTPWYLIIGDDSDNISEMMEYLYSDTRKVVQIKERLLEIDKTSWHFFNKSVMIESKDNATVSEISEMQTSHWKTLLTALVQYRPERPADGIVLALDVKHILKLGELWSADPALAINQRLWEFQKVCGFSVPIYLVLINCENIPGFTEFWNVQSGKSRKEIFGWSSPFPPASAFSTEWIDTAFTEIHETLILEQAVNATAASIDTLDNDAFFLFPQHFGQLCDPLKNLLSVLFEKNAYNQSGFLRGIYFTGTINDTDTESSPQTNRFVGVDDLFDKKIFSEKNLAVPTRDSYLSRNRFIRNLQYGMIIGSIFLVAGLIINTFQLKNYVQAFSNSLSIVKNDPKNTNVNTIYQLITSMSEMRPEAIFPFIPDSWFDNNGEKASKFLSQVAFDSIIFPLLYNSITERAKTISTLPEIDSVDPAISLTNYLGKVEAFEENLERYIYLTDSISPKESDRLPNGNKRPPIMEEFNFLLKYLYGKEISERVINKRGIHRNALEHVGFHGKFINDMCYNYYVPATCRDQLDASLIPKTDSVLKNIALLTNNINKSLIRAVTPTEQTINSLNWLLFKTEQAGNSGSEPVQLFRNIGQWFERIDTNWIDKQHEQTPGGRVAHRWSEVKKQLALFGYNNDSINIIAYGLNDENCFKDVKTTINNINLPPYTRLFKTDDHDIIQVVDTIKSEIIAWRTLKNLSFMKLEPVKHDAVYKRPVAWSLPQIELGLNYIKEYQKFLDCMQSDSLSNTSIMTSLAYSQLNAVLNDIIIASQFTNDIHFDKTKIKRIGLTSLEEQLSAVVDNLKSVAPSINEMLFILDQLNFTDVYNRLLLISKAFAADVLYKCDELVSENRLYKFDSSPVWNDDNLSSILFGLKNKDDVKKYCSNQLERIEDIAHRYAGPSVEFLVNTPENTSEKTIDIQSKWQQTLEQIERYKKGNTLNSIKELQDYISTDLLTNNRKSINDITTSNESETTYDYFSLAEREIRGLVNQYKRKYVIEYWTKKYSNISEKFNQQLAGRFPFCTNDETVKNDVSIQTAKNFFQTTTTVLDTLKKQAESIPEINKWYNDQMLFVNDLGLVSTFFSYNLFKQPDQTVPVSIRTRYRIHQDQSPGTNQIIRWKLSSDNLLSEYPDSVTLTEWSFGKPLSFELQWALNSPFRPYADIKVNRNITVDGPRISYNFKGDWALFHLLNDYKTDQNNELSKIVCCFTIPVRQLDNNPPENKVTCYARLGIELFGTDSSTKELKRIQFPVKFPAYAPVIRKEL